MTSLIASLRHKSRKRFSLPGASTHTLVPEVVTLTHFTDAATPKPRKSKSYGLLRTPSTRSKHIKFDENLADPERNPLFHFNMQLKESLEQEERLMHRRECVESPSKRPMVRRPPSPAPMRLPTTVELGRIDLDFIDFAPLPDLTLCSSSPTTTEPADSPLTDSSETFQRSPAEVGEHVGVEQARIDALVRKSAALARHYVDRVIQESKHNAKIPVQTAAPHSDVDETVSRSGSTVSKATSTLSLKEFCRNRHGGFRRSTVHSYRSKGCISLSRASSNAHLRQGSLSTLDPDDSCSHGGRVSSESWTRPNDILSGTSTIVTESSDLVANMTWLEQEESVSRINMLSQDPMSRASSLNSARQVVTRIMSQSMKEDPVVVSLPLGESDAKENADNKNVFAEAFACAGTDDEERMSIDNEERRPSTDSFLADYDDDEDDEEELGGRYTTAPRAPPNTAARGIDPADRQPSHVWPFHGFVFNDADNFAAFGAAIQRPRLTRQPHYEIAPPLCREPIAGDVCMD